MVGRTCSNRAHHKLAKMSKPTKWGNSGAKMQARNLNVPESKVKCEVLGFYYFFILYVASSIRIKHEIYLGL